MDPEVEVKPVFEDWADPAPRLRWNHHEKQEWNLRALRPPTFAPRAEVRNSQGLLTLQSSRTKLKDRIFCRVLQIAE